MSKINRHQAAIDYNIYGTGDITLLFVHGSYIDQTYFDSQVKFFSEQYKVVTFDLPGHGKSTGDRDKWSLEGFSRDTLFIISELELKNVILIGHSMGAEICLMSAAESDDIIGFISIDFFKNAVTRLPAEMISQIMAGLKKDFPAANENYARTALLTAETSAEISDRVVEDYQNAHRSMGMSIMPQMLDLHDAEKKLLPALPFKLYLVMIDYQPTEEGPLKEYLKNGYELRTLHATSHYPMLEIPDQLNDALSTFIGHIVTDQQKSALKLS